jgi:hypothetical protein
MILFYSWTEFRKELPIFDKMASLLSYRAQMSKNRSNLREELAVADLA